MTLEKWLLVAVFLQVLLIVIVGTLSLRARIASVRAGQTTLRKIALDSDNWPDETRKLGNNFDNQFQVPMMFLGLVAVLLATRSVDLVQVVLAYVFMATRYVHSYIHVGSNKVLLRFRFFFAGFAVLCAMWIIFAVRLLAIG